MTYTKRDFFEGRVGCRCDTRGGYDQLMRECEARGIRWSSRNPATGPTPSKAIQCGDPETFRVSGDHLVYNILDYDNAVPFSTLFLDPWAEFCAGRCYLRVTKEEEAAFRRKCAESGINVCTLHFDEDALVATFGNPNWISQTYGALPGYSIHPFSAIARPEPEPARKITIFVDGEDVVAEYQLPNGELRMSRRPLARYDGFEDAVIAAFDGLMLRKRDGITIDVSIDTTLAMDAVQEVHDALDKLSARVGKLATP